MVELNWEKYYTYSTLCARDILFDSQVVILHLLTCPTMFHSEKKVRLKIKDDIRHMFDAIFPKYLLIEFFSRLIIKCPTKS